MGYTRYIKKDFKIYNNEEEIKKILDITNKYNIKVNANNYNERKRNIYPDYVTYNSYRESDKLYNLGLYYKEYAKNTTEQGFTTAEKEVIKRASCLFFRDALLIKRNEPDYILETIDCSASDFE